MIWDVIYSSNAENDLQEIFNYISLTLLEPETAERQTERIMDAADSLISFPFRYRIYNVEPWRSKGLRILPIDNYVILYQPDESTNLVKIVRIMYGGRDINKQLLINERQ
jgi:toxin ParE1/3/4